MTRSKHESTATIKLVNLVTKRDSVFMAFSCGTGPRQTSFWRENAVLAHPFWLRLRCVRKEPIGSALDPDTRGFQCLDLFGLGRFRERIPRDVKPQVRGESFRAV